MKINRQKEAEVIIFCVGGSMGILESIRNFFTLPAIKDKAQQNPEGFRDWRTMHTKLVGVSFRNDDGSSRQHILSRVFPGDTLKVEPYFFRGEPALGVYTLNDQMLGNIRKEIAAELNDEGIRYYYARVDHITGGDERNIGCNITLYFSD